MRASRTRPAARRRNAVSGPHELPPLPYDKDALEPHISARTLALHHGVHHAGYVSKLNEAVKGTSLAGLELEDLILEVAADEKRTAIFNHAAQAWNHAFYWNSMQPGGGGKPAGRLAKLVQGFGGLAKLKQELAKAAEGQFGSGWAWLVLDGEGLAVMKTSNADLPLAHGKKALLACDVWEHAYYLDYENRREEYVSAFLESLVSWEFAARNLAG